MTPSVPLTHMLAPWVEQNVINGKSITLAVSGGADSMALMLLLSQMIPASQLRVLTVDHGLRHGSAAEARWTHGQAARMGVPCEILTPDVTPGGNLQASARMARYKALVMAARDSDASCLCTAHTLDDQAETILARMSRGSGTKGMAGMAEIADIPGADPDLPIKLHRPLLTLRRGALRTYLMEQGQRWAEDPSNQNMQFDRIRLRTLLASWEKSGFTAERIVGMGHNMRRSDTALEHYARAAFAAVTRPATSSALKVDRKAYLQYPEDTRLRVLTKVLQDVSGKPDTVRLVKLANLQKSVQKGETARLTLHGCILSISNERIVCEPERIPPDKVELSGL